MSEPRDDARTKNIQHGSLCKSHNEPPSECARHVANHPAKVLSARRALQSLHLASRRLVPSHTHEHGDEFPAWVEHRFCKTELGIALKRCATVRRARRSLHSDSDFAWS